MQHKILAFLVSVTLLQVILAHLCILDPPQRGPLSIKMPGDSNCYRPYAECGNQPPQTPKITWIAGYVFKDKKLISSAPFPFLSLFQSINLSIALICKLVFYLDFTMN